MARLILLYIQSHVHDDGTVPLGKSLSGWMSQALGLSVTGGDRGTLGSVKNQLLRLARARFSLQWADDNGNTVAIADEAIADGIHLWDSVDPSPRKWVDALHLTPSFADGLKEHRMPLADHAIRQLRGSSFGLDVYLFLAYRLPKISVKQAGRPIPWKMIAEQFAADYARPDHFSRRFAEVLPAVQAAYPEARVAAAKSGLCMWKSEPAVPSRRRS